MASRRSWVRIPSAPPFEETKELTFENRQLLPALLPAFDFPLAFKQESFRLAEEKRIWPVTLSSRASTQATADFRSSMCSSLRIIVRLRSKERPTISVRPVAASALRLRSGKMSALLTLP